MLEMHQLSVLYTANSKYNYLGLKRVPRGMNRRFEKVKVIYGNNCLSQKLHVIIYKVVVDDLENESTVG